MKTIEEKAKAYDEIIVKAKEYLKDCPDRVDAKGCITHLFPELKESEDEKKLSELMEYFKLWEICPEYTEEVNTWIKGLIEKQGKQKPTAEEVLIKAGLKPYKDGNQWCILVGDNIQEGICGFGDTIEDALYDFLKGICETKQKQGEKKPVDIKPIFEVGDVMRTKEEAEKDWKDGMPVVVSIDDKYYHCNNELIEIKDQYDYEYPPINKKQKPEWSEEDEQIVYAITDNLEMFVSGQSDKSIKALYDKRISWLKSLKDRCVPQKQWKPSEEQMKALDDAIYDSVGKDYHKALSQLDFDIKRKVL